MKLARSRPQDVDLIILLPSRLFGGAERTITNLVEGMQQLPQSPRVVMLAYADMLQAHLPAGAAVEMVDMADWGLLGGVQSVSGIRRDAQVIHERLAPRLNPDRKTVVLCFLHYGAALAVWLKRCFRRDAGVRVVASPRGPSVLGIPMITLNARERLLWHVHIAAAGRFCDAVVVPSEGMRQELVARYHASPARVHAVANSYPSKLDEVWASRRSDQTTVQDDIPSRFVMATRLSGEKNIDLALRAFARHLKVHPEDTFTIVGDGPAREELERLIAQAGMANRVTLENFRAQPFELIASHDVYVHTCLIEGFGNSMLEALALGVPVVATDCDFGPRQLIMHGINGLLVPVCNEGALAGALTDIKTLRMSKLRFAARESAKAYSNFLMAARYVDVFCKV